MSATTPAPGAASAPATPRRAATVTPDPRHSTDYVIAWSAPSRTHAKTGPKPRPSDDRFWEKVDASGDCWEWTGAKTGGGYGNFHDGKINVVAHRYAYARLVGPIPEGMVLDHLCRNHACVNPDHLRVVTRRENTLCGYNSPANNARKTHCHRGHPLAGDNLRIRSSGDRFCKACRRIRTQNARARGGMVQ